MKQYRTIIILLGILLVLGGVATWDEWMTDKETEQEETRNQIAPFEIAQVTKIQYQKPGAGEDSEPVEVVIVKDEGDWRITAPVEARADGDVVKSFLTTLADYKYERIANEDKTAWSQYGLDTPKRTIEITYQEGESSKAFNLLIGEKAAVGYSVYFRLGDSERVLLGSQYLLVSTSKSLHDFRDKRLTYTTQRDVASFSYQRKGVEGFRLERTEGNFALVSPESYDTDHNAAMDFLGDVFGIKVTTFFDTPEDQLKRLFDDPGIVLTWTTKDGATATLKALYHEGKYYASFDPEKQIVQIPTSLNSKLSKEIIDFRNRRILEFDSSDVIEVVVDDQVYQRFNGNWYTQENYGKVSAAAGESAAGEAEEDAPTAEGHIRSFLVDMEFAKTREFFSEDSVAASRLPDVPQNKVILKFKVPEEGAQRADLTIEVLGPDGQGHQYVRHSESDALFSIPNTSLDSLKKSESDQDLDKAEAGEAAGLNKGE